NDPDDSPCDDANQCTLGELCTSGTCGGGTAKDCDDDDLCTADTCEALTGCQHDGEVLDANACYAPGKFGFTIKDTGPDTSQLQWKWKNGEPVLAEDLGTPALATVYSLCVFDEVAGVPELVGSYSIPAGAAWSSKPDAVKYVDKSASGDGITSFKAKSSMTAGKSSIGLKAKGANL